eukprot:CAMPEP_0201514428 /NCGR_PEP_ID=MMETSP0161_2-20130828/6276_1 /ASSEMBLY_ACC=CAM_ASM_000251 /TAXON_ID=180227 /ORGANISM="Neoparamoeba aestuarina, Strain SoJaBio B1-5/56/2" /LENGTH=159 /DNA_ID=CAMNT_0047910977 /DNA_START=322 /DNA_END=801 /DNA_ORIENTATION=+
MDLPNEFYDDKFDLSIDVNELDSTRIKKSLQKAFKKLDASWEICDDGLGERGFYHDRAHFPTGKAAIPCQTAGGIKRAVVVDFESNSVYPVEQFPSGEINKLPNIATGPGNQTALKDGEARPTYNDFVQLRKCTFPLPKTLEFDPIDAGKKRGDNEERY